MSAGRELAGTWRGGQDETTRCNECARAGTRRNHGRNCGADPDNAKNAFFVTATCENGVTYEVVTNGNGDFTAAHDLNSTATLIPFAFGVFTFTVTDPQGNVVDSGSEPGATKRAAAQHDLVGCPFTFSETDPDGFTLAGSGTAFVKIVPGQ